MSEQAGRDRVLEAVARRQPDRIPIDYWAVDPVTERLIEHFGVADREQLLERLGVDLRYVLGPSYAGQHFRSPVLCRRGGDPDDGPLGIRQVEASRGQALDF